MRYGWRFILIFSSSSFSPLLPLFGAASRPNLWLNCRRRPRRFHVQNAQSCRAQLIIHVLARSRYNYKVRLIRKSEANGRSSRYMFRSYKYWKTIRQLVLTTTQRTRHRALVTELYGGDLIIHRLRVKYSHGLGGSFNVNEHLPATTTLIHPLFLPRQLLRHTNAHSSNCRHIPRFNAYHISQ